jgi:hypothetical protein
MLLSRFGLSAVLIWGYLLLYATIDKNILGAADGLLPLPTPLSSGWF